MRGVAREITTRSVLAAILLVIALFGSGPGGGLAQTATGTDTPSPTSTPAALEPTPISTTATLDTETSTPTATPDPAPLAPLPSLDPSILGTANGGGPRNVMKLQNVQDNTLRVDGNVQLGRIPGPMIAPVNLAQSYASCTNCQTLAVALQVDLITADTMRATPENVAVAINYQCTQCDTIAVAIQYVLTVDDPTQVPDRANQLVAQMRQELVQMRGDQSLTLPEAEARVDNVIGQFQDFAADLSEQRDESTAATTTPNATPPGT